MGEEIAQLQWSSIICLFILWTVIFQVCDRLAPILRQWMKRTYQWQIDPLFDVQFASYVVSLVHALLVTFRGFMHIYELRTNTELSQPVIYYANVYVNAEAEIARRSVLLTVEMVTTYLIHDSIYTITRFPHMGEFAMIFHHMLYISGAIAVGGNGFAIYVFSWIFVTEISTPVLNLRWFLRAVGLKRTALAKHTNLFFVFTFVLSRVIGFGYGLVDMMINLPALMKLTTPRWAVYYGVAFIYAAYSLNLFWFYKIFERIIPSLLKGTTKQQKVVENATEETSGLMTRS